MFDRLGRDALGRSVMGSRGRSRAGKRLRVEPLEGRSLMTASLAPIPSVTVEASQGYQVPLNGAYGTNTDPQTYTVTTNSPTGGVTATVGQGQFWTVGVSHTSSGGTDPSFSGTMTFQLFQDLTPNSVAKIESLITGTVPFNQLTPQAQKVIYPGGANSKGQDYYVVGGNTFHRISGGFPGPNDYIVQGGSLNGDGTGQVFATPYANENPPQLVFNGYGQLALANSGPNTNDSQFFVTTGQARGLNPTSTAAYTIFGQLVAGADILADMTRVTGTPLPNGLGTSPTNKISITSSTLSTTNPDGVIHINAANSTAGAQTNVTVTATDTVDHSQVSQTFPVLTVPSGSTTPTTTTAPRLNPVATPVNTGANAPVTFQLSAFNPTGGTLSYTVQGGLANGAFTPLPSTTATATVSSSGLVTVTPATGFTGPINLVVGVSDGTNRAGSGATATSPANYSLQDVTVNVGTFPTAPKINPVTTPITVSVSQNAQIQLSATNPTGGQLTYVVNGGLNTSTNTFNPTIANATASVDANGLVTVVPNPGYIGPINILVGVRDQINRAGTGQPLDSPTNFSTENLVVNVVQPVSTGAVRFILDSSTSATGNLVITPLPRPSGTARNTINVTQANGNIQVMVNGSMDLNQPAVGNVDSIVVYGSKANDRVTIDPSLTMPATLSGGTGGHNVLIAGGGPTRQQGWYGTTVEKQGESNNYLFGRKGKVTFVKGSGSSDVIFAGTPFHPRGHSRIRRIPPPPQGTFYTFSGGKLVKTSNPFTTPATTTRAGKK